MTPLTQFLNGWLKRPAEWSHTDCCATACLWVDAIRGTSTAEALAWQYDDVGSAERFSRFFTHPKRAVLRFLVEPAGLEPTDAPTRGDIVCLKAPYGGVMRPAMALGVGKGFFAMRSAPGEAPAIYSVKPDRFIGAWSVGYRDP